MDISLEPSGAGSTEAFPVRGNRDARVFPRKCRNLKNAISREINHTNSSRFDDLVSQRVSNQLAHTMQLELSHDVGSMRLRRLPADVQRGSHFLTALAFGE